MYSPGAAAKLAMLHRRLSLSCSQAAVGVRDKWSHEVSDLRFRAQPLSIFGHKQAISLEVFPF